MDSAGFDLSPGHSRTMELNSQDVLEQLTALQQLLYRLIDCRTGGVANNNYQVQYALAQALKESFKIYCAINDGIINLIDKFFEMPKHAALKALDVYKRAVQQAGNLSHFYESCQGLELARNFQFPTLREIGTGGSFFGPLFVHAHPEIGQLFIFTVVCSLRTSIRFKPTYPNIVDLQIQKRHNVRKADN